MTPPCHPGTLTARELHHTRRVHTSAGQQLLSEISHLRTRSRRGVKYQRPKRRRISHAAAAPGAPAARQGERVSSLRWAAGPGQTGSLRDEKIKGVRALSAQARAGRRAGARGAEGGRAGVNPSRSAMARGRRRAQRPRPGHPPPRPGWTRKLARAQRAA